MLDYQREFIKFAIDTDVLRFGEFTLKSGRVSPYFFNAGLFNTGEALSRLGEFYADAIMQSELSFDVLYGPAYKGIPLACSVAIALHTKYSVSKPWVFNRKEAKTHGEGGSLVGSELVGQVLIIDDVITAGTAIRESFALIDAAGANLAGVCVSIDRQERGQADVSAIQEVETDHQLKVTTIATLDTIINFLQHESLQTTDYRDSLTRILAYRDEYGVAGPLG